MTIYDVDVIAFECSEKDKTGLRIAWDSDIGFGQYDLIFTNKAKEDADFFETECIEGYSECMDSNVKKEFIKALFDKIIEKIDVRD